MLSEKRDPRVDEVLEAIEKSPDTLALTHAKILAAEVQRLDLALEITKEAGRKIAVERDALKALDDACAAIDREVARGTRFSFCVDHTKSVREHLLEALAE